MRNVTILWIAFAACLAAAAPALGQASDRKPPPATRDSAKQDDKAGAPRAAQPDERAKQREKPSARERIKLDAPVSFPVDI